MTATYIRCNVFMMNTDVEKEWKVSDPDWDEIRHAVNTAAGEKIILTDDPQPESTDDDS